MFRGEPAHKCEKSMLFTGRKSLELQREHDIQGRFPFPRNIAHRNNDFFRVIPVKKGLTKNEERWIIGMTA
jgi:hypothetical protein